MGIKFIMHIKQQGMAQKIQGTLKKRKKKKVERVWKTKVREKAIKLGKPWLMPACPIWEIKMSDSAPHLHPTASL